MKMKKVSLLLPEKMYEELKRLVQEGEFPNVNEAIRTAIRVYLSLNKR